MHALTREYFLNAKEELSLERQRGAMDFFRFKFEVAISPMASLSDFREMGYLPTCTIYPERSEFMTPILITPMINNGTSLEDANREDRLRRIYQVGRTSISLRCIPNFENMTDKLHFVFVGAYNRDINPAVKAIKNIVSETDRLNSNALQWYRQ